LNLSLKVVKDKDLAAGFRRFAQFSRQKSPIMRERSYLKWTVLNALLESDSGCSGFQLIETSIGITGN